jgi:hypothetical protein
MLTAHLAESQGRSRLDFQAIAAVLDEYLAKVMPPNPNKPFPTLLNELTLARAEAERPPSTSSTLACSMTTSLPPTASKLNSRRLCKYLLRAVLAAALCRRSNESAS